LGKICVHNFVVTNDRRPSVHQLSRTFKRTTVVGQSKTVHMTIRVRSDKFHYVIEEIRKIVDAVVYSLSTNSQDVTDEYVGWSTQITDVGIYFAVWFIPLGLLLFVIKTFCVCTSTKQEATPL
jgi:hypothetical protein